MRIKGGTKARQYRKSIKNKASGARGTRHTSYRVANQTVIKAGQYAYRDRKAKKREFRKLWITRISAAVKPFNLNYSKFIYLLKKNKIVVNRKILSQLAVEHENEFNKIVEKILPKK